MPQQCPCSSFDLWFITAIIIRVAIRDEWYGWYLRIRLGAIRLFWRHGQELGRSFIYHHPSTEAYYLLHHTRPGQFGSSEHTILVYLIACPQSLQVAQVAGQKPLVSIISIAQMRYKQCLTDRLLVNNRGPGVRLSTLAESEAT
jgi:hypothetical protein